MLPPRFRKKKSGPRSTSGCLTCRLRRKKCDERKPGCVGCERNGLMCTWPPASGGITTTPKTASWRRQLASGSAGATWGSSLSSSSASSVLSTSLSPFTQSFRQHLAKGASSTLFDHFVQVSATQLSGRVVPENPFLTHLLPLAHTHDSVLQALLAISGGHLYSHSARFEHEARTHYAVALRSVKHQLTRWTAATDTSAAETVALLAATVLLGIFEVVVGNTDGSLFYHLRASRALLLHLRKRPQLQQQNSLAKDLDFLTEQYAFQAICTNVTLHTDFPLDRDIPDDELVHSLHQLNRHSRSYGVMFGMAHQLFELIPRIMQSARDALSSQEHGDREDPSIESVKGQYENLIRRWRPLAEDWQRSSSSSTVMADLESSGRVYQQALLLFLHAAFFNGGQRPSTELCTRMDAYVDEFLRRVRTIPPDAHMVTTMMWPVLVAGSCMRQPDQRQMLSRLVGTAPVQMGSSKRVQDVLLALWEQQDTDATVYGIYGLEQVMRQKQINICVG